MNRDLYDALALLSNHTDGGEWDEVLIKEDVEAVLSAWRKERSAASGAAGGQAELVEQACDWKNYPQNVDHLSFHFGNLCPYEVCAALLRGEPDPRRGVGGQAEPSERRAKVQAEGGKPYGTVAWWEHVEAWNDYHRRYPGQSAERIHERGGFGYGELVDHLGHLPTTWLPRTAAAAVSGEQA